MNAFLKSGKLGASSAKPSTSTATKPGKQQHRTLPWVEKYRPRTVEDIAEQTEVVAVLQQCMLGGDLPNFLFYGPPGTGKTSTILAAARQLFGDMYKDRVLEVNVSDERGIQTYRDKIKTFAQLSAGGTRPDGKPCPTFKIIILDEADAMTHAAQSALRRTMEKESKSTRFCILCNYISRIIEPLKSRCTKFRFKPLNNSIICEKLEGICKEEKLQCDENVLSTLVEKCEGDMRKAITTLQSCFRLSGKEKVVTVDDVYEVLGYIPEHWLKEYLAIKDYKLLKNFLTLEFFPEGYSALQFFVQLNDHLVETDQFNDEQKVKIAKRLGDICYKVQDGSDEMCELINLGCFIIAEVY